MERDGFWRNRSWLIPNFRGSQETTEHCLARIFWEGRSKPKSVRSWGLIICRFEPLILKKKIEPVRLPFHAYKNYSVNYTLRSTIFIKLSILVLFLKKKNTFMGFIVMFLYESMCISTSSTKLFVNIYNCIRSVIFKTPTLFKVL